MNDTMICAVCRRVLDVYTDADGVTWKHTLQDAQTNHEPVPIPMPDDYREGRCDFCNQDDMAFRIPVQDFEVPGLDGHMSRGDWAACRYCARLIEGNRWNDLLTRVMAAREQRGQDAGPEMRSWLSRLYRTVRKNISGSLKSI